MRALDFLTAGLEIPRVRRKKPSSSTPARDRRRVDRGKSETVDGNCVVCNAKTPHLVKKTKDGTEYFECSACGNETDVKAFVYDNLDALSG